MAPQSFSNNPDRTLNQLTNVEIDDLTLATGDVIIYDAPSSRWKNGPEGSTGNAGTINVTETDTDASYYPTFVDSAGNTKTLRCNAGTTPWSVNPNTGEFLLQPTIKVGGAVSNGRVAIGANAGQTGAGIDSTCCGNGAGNINVGIGSCSFGLNAGASRQANGALALGANSAVDRQGRSSIAIGNLSANGTPQPDNQICINSSGLAFTGPNPASCYINQLARRDNGSGNGNVSYDPVSKELTYSTT
jgi:hypothetical protein